MNIEFVSLDRRAADTERRALARENRSLRLSVAVMVGLKFDPWLGVIVLGAWLGLIVGTWLVQREYARNIRWRNAPWV